MPTLGLVFDDFSSFSDDQCYQFQVIEVIPSSFRSSQNDENPSNTRPNPPTPAHTHAHLRTTIHIHEHPHTLRTPHTYHSLSELIKSNEIRVN